MLFQAESPRDGQGKGRGETDISGNHEEIRVHITETATQEKNRL